MLTGAEPSKGNELTKEAFKLLEHLDGFVGNVEGRDIFNGSVNVVVCDGFTGNILLKASEGVVSTIFSMMKQHMRRSLPAKFGALLMKKKVFANLKKEVDYEEYGGAPLLGVDGCAIVSHGSSSAKAIKNAIFQAISLYQIRCQCDDRSASQRGTKNVTLFSSFPLQLFFTLNFYETINIFMVE